MAGFQPCCQYRFSDHRDPLPSGGRVCGTPREKPMGHCPRIYSGTANTGRQDHAPGPGGNADLFYGRIAGRRFTGESALPPPRHCTHYV